MFPFRKKEGKEKANKEIYKVSAKYIQEVLVTKKKQDAEIRTMSGG